MSFQFSIVRDDVIYYAEAHYKFNSSEIWPTQLGQRIGWLFRTARCYMINIFNKKSGPLEK